MKKILQNCYLAIIFLFLYAPIAVLMIFSFNDNKSRVRWYGFTLDWYVELFQDSQILNSLYVTLVVALAAAVISTLLGTVAAMGIHCMKRRSKTVYLTLNNIPMSTSDTIMGVTFMLLFAALSLPKGYLTLILAHTTFCTPYIFMLVKGRLAGMDSNLESAARDLGASPAKAFFTVTLPLILPGVLSGVMLAFAMSMDDFVISFFVTGSNVNPLPLVIYSSVKTGVSPQVNALCTLILLFVFVVAGVSLFGPARKKNMEVRK